MPKRSSRLADLFRDTAEAHHRAFASTDGEDPDWPTWYAEYLAPRLEELLGRRFLVETLVTDLEAMDTDHRRGAGAEPWPEFYARSFLHRHSVDT